ncbi:hypothetical protein DIPPA_29390 [Diplonema papillatum]|nr:hypothetical protein DIPPA_29390 [Diplonema papillatum]
MMDKEKISELTAAEARLRAERDRMQAEVQRLKLLVQTAANDLTQAERQSCDAGAKVEHAAQAFEASAHAEQHAATAFSQPQQQPDDSSSTGTADPCEAPARKVRRRRLTVSKSAPTQKLGLFFSNQTPEVTRVYPGLAAAKAGVRTGMVVVGVGQKKVATLRQLDGLLEEAAKDLSLDLVVEYEASDDGGDDGGEAELAALDLSSATSESVQHETDEEDDFVVIQSPQSQQQTSAPTPARTTAAAAQTQNAGGEELRHGSEREEEQRTKSEGAGQPPRSTAAAAAAAAPPQASVMDLSSERLTHSKIDLYAPPQAPNAGAVPDSAPGAEAAAAAAKLSFLDPSMPLPEFDLESFQAFCKKYAEEHPEMVNNDVPQEDPREELLRLQEEQRMRELHEDPTAMRELLLRTMEKVDRNKAIEHGLSARLATDDWKRDYESRVQRQEDLKNSCAAQPPLRVPFAGGRPDGPPAAQPAAVQRTQGSRSTAVEVKPDYTATVRQVAAGKTRVLIEEVDCKQQQQEPERQQQQQVLQKQHQHGPKRAPPPVEQPLLTELRSTKLRGGAVPPATAAASPPPAALTPPRGTRKNRSEDSPDTQAILESLDPERWA